MLDYIVIFFLILILVCTSTVLLFYLNFSDIKIIVRLDFYWHFRQMFSIRFFESDDFCFCNASIYFSVTRIDILVAVFDS